MRNPGGYAQLVDPEFGIKECDTFTCCHCNKIVHVPPKVSMDQVGSWCTLCMKPTCPGCASTGECKPFEKQLEQMEARARFRCEV